MPSFKRNKRISSVESVDLDNNHKKTRSELLDVYLIFNL